MSICRKDDGWKLSRGVYIFVIIGLVLLLGAISALIVYIKPWTVSAMHFLLSLISFSCVCNPCISFTYPFLTFICFFFGCNHFFPITTDRGSISLGSPPHGISNWCHPPLGIKQFLFELDRWSLCASLPFY